MRDVDALRIRLTMAIALAGVGPACGKDEASAQDGVSVQFGKIKGNPDKKREPEGGSSSGGGEESSTGPAKPPVDPVEFCRTEEMTFTVADAKKERRPGTGETHDCPVSINAPGGYPMLQLRDNATGLLRDAGDDLHCCYEEDRPPRVIKGRPLALGGGAWAPRYELGAPRGRVASLAAAAGEAWLADARAEWASVPAFERAADELRAQGAPQRLITACHDAADDERRHTAACVQIASRLLDREIALQPLPLVEPRPLDLYGLLRATFLEGAVAETVAALVAGRGASKATDPQVERALRTIADEETEHAALAWETIAWGFGRLAPKQRQAFVAWAFEQRPDSARPPRSSTHDLSAWGQLAARDEAHVVEQAWDGCIGPALRAVLAEAVVDGGLQPGALGSPDT